MQKPNLVHFIVPPAPATTPRATSATTTPTPPPPKSDTALQATTTECPPNNSVYPSTTKNVNSNNLLRKLASSHYQSYTTALTVTIAVGCFLLLLNILIFAGIYHQRDRDKSNRKKKELIETGSCSSSSGENYDHKAQYDVRQLGYDQCKNPYELSTGNTFECKTMANFIGEYSCEKRSISEVQMTELTLQDFKSSPPPGIKREGIKREQGILKEGTVNPGILKDSTIRRNSMRESMRDSTRESARDSTRDSMRGCMRDSTGDSSLKASSRDLNGDPSDLVKNSPSKNDNSTVRRNSSPGIKWDNPHSCPPDVTSTHEQHLSPSIPEPPPPPRNQPPGSLCNQSGILRAHGAPTTPGTSKKRVQIQEISV